MRDETSPGAAARAGRGEPHPAAGLVQVQRLDPETVTHQHTAPFPVVDEREREHAHEAVDESSPHACQPLRSTSVSPWEKNR
jgi:hypothetical protein